MSIFTKLTKKYDNAINNAEQKAHDDYTFIKEYPFIANNPFISEIGAGLADTGKFLGDLERNVFPNGLPSINNFSMPQNKEPILGTDFSNNVERISKLSPQYNDVHGLAKMAPQALMIEQLGGETLAQKVGSMAKKALSSYGNSVAEKVIQKSIPLLSKSAVRATTFTATDPRAITGKKLDNSNILNNINTSSLASSFGNNLAMFTGFDTAGSVLKGLTEVPYKESINTAKQFTNKFVDKVKPKYDIKGNKRESRVYTEDVKNKKDVFNNTDNFSDINLFDDKHINNISKSLKEDNVAILHSNYESNINIDKLKNKAHPDKDTILLFIPEADKQDISIIENKSGIDSSTMKQLSEHFELEPEQINKLINDNHVILYTDTTKKPNSKYLKDTLEHELGHIVNIKRQGYAQSPQGLSKDNRTKKLAENGYNANEISYYMNQQEATQQLGSIVKKINDSKNKVNLSDEHKNALKLYSIFTGEKINLNNILKQELLDKVNNISNKLEQYFKEHPPEQQTGSIQMQYKPHNRTKVINELKNNINEHLKETSGEIYDDFTSLKNDVEVTSRTKKEHINILMQLDKEVNKASKAVDIKRVIKLQKEKFNYVKKLYKMFGFENNEKITRLNKQLEDIEKRISNAVTRNVEINDNPVDIKNKGIVKKTNGKIIHSEETLYGKHLVNEYQRLTKELKKEENNVRTTLNNIFMNKKLYNDLQIFRLNELVQKYNDLLIKKASDMKTPEKYDEIDIQKELQKNKNLEQISLTKRSGSKKIKTFIEKEKNKKKDPLTNDQIKKKNNELLYRLKKDLVGRKLKGETKEKMQQWLANKKWNRHTKEQVLKIINDVYKEDKKNNNERQKINKKEQSTEDNNNNKNIKEKTVKKLQDKIDNATNVSFEYVKHHLKQIYFSVKAEKSKYAFNIKAKEILGKINDKNIIDGYYDTGSSNHIFKVSFQTDNHTLNFLNETRLIAHELTHLFIDKVKNYKDLNNIVVPEKVKELYSDTTIAIQREEAIALYTELRSMQDLIKNSNLSKLIKNKGTLYKEISNEIQSIFDSNVNDFEQFYKNNMQYNIFSNLKSMYKEPLFNHKYFIEHTDKIGKQLIDNFMQKIYKNLSKNKNIKYFIDTLNGKDFIKNAIEDYKISHSSEKLYVKIREIISNKNRMMNTIKNLNNNFVKMISKDLGKIDRTTQKHIHNSDILNSFFSSGHEKLNKYIDNLIKNKDLYMDTFIKDNIPNKTILFKKIIEASSIPMNNHKLYFRNAEQIALYLKKNNMLKKTKIYDLLIQDINNLLSAEYLSKNKFDSSIVKHIINKSESVLVANEIRRKAKEALGNNYIRGYRSFISKKPLIAKLGLFNKEPIYTLDTRGGVDNNLLEFKQDGILGAEFRINILDKKSKIKLQNIKLKLDKQRIPYSILYDKNMNEIGIKRYIEQYLDEEKMGSEFDIAENIASQHTSIMLNSVNYHIAEAIQKDLKGIFLTEKDIQNIKTKDRYVLLSKEEQKIFHDISNNSGEQIKYIKKEFKDLLDQQREFLFTKDNQKIARAIELSYKNIIKEFKKNVVVKNIKSQLNNAIIILTTTAQHNLNAGSITRDIMRSPKEYKLFYETIYNIRKEVLNGNNGKAKIMFENLKRQNVYAQMYQNGLFQTMADDYLMKVFDKESLQSYHINKFLNDIFGSDTVNAINSIKDFVLLEPNTFLGSNLLKSMNFIDITGRATLYKNLLKKGHSIEEASRITNESFVDFRRTYPKIVNELDNYGLFFAGFMYKNTINLLKFMKDKPITTASVILSYLTIKQLFDDISPVKVKTDSWLYQKSMATPSYIDMSLFGSLSNGKLPAQLILPNTTLMFGKAVKTCDITKTLPITIGNQYK